MAGLRKLILVFALFCAISSLDSQMPVETIEHLSFGNSLFEYAQQLVSQSDVNILTTDFEGLAVGVLQNEQLMLVYSRKTKTNAGAAGVFGQRMYANGSLIGPKFSVSTLETH